MSDVKPGTWSVPESPLNIEYSLVVIDEIRRSVADGVQKLSRGGMEVGGVLYGLRDGETLCLLATRPIVCEHARGPAFQFSDNDRAALVSQLQQSGDDPHLSGFTCLGWFVSHTRSGIQLVESDLDIYNSFFPEPWQVTLVVRPGRGMSMRAGFFLREFDGALRTESSYLEFAFPDRLGALFERPARTDHAASEPGAHTGQPPSSRAVAEARARAADARANMEARLGMEAPAAANTRVNTASAAAPALDRFAPPDTEPVKKPPPIPAVDPVYEPPPLFTATPAPAKKSWGWLALWALLLAVLGFAGWRYFGPRPLPEPIGLTLAEKDGVIQVQWNHAAKPILDAARGSLDITDGKDSHTLPLTAADLASGSFSFQRSTGDVEVRLSVESSSGGKVQEGSRYLGSAPAPAAAKSEDIQALQQRRDQLEKEVERLRAQTSQQNTRIQQLERTVRILQTRLGQK